MNQQNVTPPNGLPLPGKDERPTGNHHAISPLLQGDSTEMCNIHVSFVIASISKYWETLKFFTPTFENPVRTDKSQANWR